MTDITFTFTHGQRVWLARRMLSESGTQSFWRIVPAKAGRPFPTREEHQAARRFFDQTHKSKPAIRKARAAFDLLKP